MKKIVSLHDFEKVEILEQLAQRDHLSVQDKEHLYVIATRFRDILGEVVIEQLGQRQVNHVVRSQVNEVIEK